MFENILKKRYRKVTIIKKGNKIVSKEKYKSLEQKLDEDRKIKPKVDEFYDNYFKNNHLVCDVCSTVFTITVNEARHEFSSDKEFAICPICEHKIYFKAPKFIES